MLRVATSILAVLLTVTGCPLFPVDDGDAGDGDGAGKGEGEGEGEVAFEGEGEGEIEIPADACDPVVDGSASIGEGDVLDVLIRCATGKLVDFEVPSIPVLPTGLSLDADNHLRWTTDLDDATVVDVEVRDPETREKVIVHVAVADAFGVEGNVPVVDPLTYTEELGLPVLFLSAQPQREEYVDAELVADGHRYAIETKLRGASSLGYPKRSFTLKFDTDDRFNLAPRAGQTTASAFVDKKKVVLVSTFDDHAYVRQRLAYQVWNRTGDGGHVIIGSTSVAVYVDGLYFGLYALVDHVDRDLFEESLGLDDGGQLYKAVNHDASFRNAGNPSAGYERRDEPDVDAVAPFSDLGALITFANTATDEEFATGLGAFIDVDDVIDWWVFATAIAGEDSYGKNSYLYRPATQTDDSGVEVTPVFRFAPWDFNQSFGQSWQTSRVGADMPIDSGWPMQTNLLWERLLRSDDENALRERYGSEIEFALGEREVATLFETMVQETEAAARKDASVWADDYLGYFGHADLGDYDSEVELVRGWIAARWSFLRTQAPPPVLD